MFTFHRGLKIRKIRPRNRTACTRTTSDKIQEWLWSVIGWLKKVKVNKLHLNSFLVSIVNRVSRSGTMKYRCEWKHWCLNSFRLTTRDWNHSCISTQAGIEKVWVRMIIRNISNELCLHLESSFGTNAIVLVFIKHTVVRVVPLTQ